MKVMASLEYRKGKGDSTLFIKHLKKGKAAILVYADDTIIMGDDEE